MIKLRLLLYSDLKEREYIHFFTFFLLNIQGFFVDALKNLQLDIY